MKSILTQIIQGILASSQRNEDHRRDANRISYEKLNFSSPTYDLSVMSRGPRDS